MNVNHVMTCTSGVLITVPGNSTLKDRLGLTQVIVEDYPFNETVVLTDFCGFPRSSSGFTPEHFESTSLILRVLKP